MPPSPGDGGRLSRPGPLAPIVSRPTRRRITGSTTLILGSAVHSRRSGRRRLDPTGDRVPASEVMGPGGPLPGGSSGSTRVRGPSRASGSACGTRRSGSACPSRRFWADPSSRSGGGSSTSGPPLAADPSGTTGCVMIPSSYPICYGKVRYTTPRRVPAEAGGPGLIARLSGRAIDRRGPAQSLSASEEEPLAIRAVGSCGPGYDEGGSPAGDRVDRRRPGPPEVFALRPESRVGLGPKFDVPKGTVLAPRVIGR